MFFGLFDTNEKQIKKILPIVDKINSFESEFEKLSDSEIKEKTFFWKSELQGLSHKEQQDYLNKILPEAFALVREGAKRSLKMRHYDVQLISGVVLHQGKISEQKTGEGKTLTASLPLYLNSLTGKGVHLVTPNDYLSRHGAGWMGTLYDFLGVSVGVIMQDKSYKYDNTFTGNEFEDNYAIHLKEYPRREIYKCDIVYGTNHEFGFDFLRDNLVRDLGETVQINSNEDGDYHHFAIVDEVDSILIDMSRTPLIISAKDSKSSSRYHEATRIIKSLTKDSDYEVEEKYKNATLTDIGIRRVERLLGVDNLYEQDFEMVHLIEQSLIANSLYEKNKDYVVKDGNVLIVDQFTGRILENNRFSNGLHQALESKEGVTIQDESKTLAEISYQNYFRMYKKLAGMTGTALTEAEEFYKIYNLDVVVIPTNSPLTRVDSIDIVYKTISAKFKAVADEIEEKYKKGQPVLVGTTSVEKSELLHNYLKRKGVPHEILNAKNHEREALIISQAGKKGSITISTNMAGRGVDILLGGDPFNKIEYENVKELGGLHVIGTERHESRRIDNQLRGRSGRQGDPGSSRFYISLQDDLMRIFGGAQVENLMNKFGMDENTPLESGLVSRVIENAQKKVEGFNFDRRKQLVEMDDVINVHRDVVYKLRRKILCLNVTDPDSTKWLLNNFINHGGFDSVTWEKNVNHFSETTWIKMVRDMSLPVIDLLWMEHLVDMDQIREGIGLRGYAQRDPMVEYKREGHERFEILISKIYSSIVERISNVTKVTHQTNTVLDLLKKANYQQGSIESGVSEENTLLKEANNRPRFIANGKEVKVSAVESNANKVGRNDPCPCGSGKKYKNCHMNS